MTMILPATPSLLLTASFIILAVGMTLVFGRWTGRYIWGAAWLFGTGALAGLGVFQDVNLPPRFMLLFVPAIITLSVVAWRSDWHERPLAFLVGFQAFRILVELGIHQAAVEGVAPPQMSWEGRNLDILTGITALMLIPFVDRLPTWSLHAWNFAGAALLLNVVSVAILSMPTPFQVFEPDNTWVLFFPFSWLPLVLVMMAWLGHLMLFKRLRADALTKS